MGTSTLIWIGGTIVVVGVFLLIKNKTTRVIEPTPDRDRGGTGTGTSPEPLPPSPPPTQSFKPNPIKAKKAFMNHLNDFSKLLPTLLEGFKVNDWTGAIVNVNDKDLTGLWENYVNLGDTSTKWMQLLASWQIKSDTCKSFTCVTNDNIAAYSLPDGGNLAMNTKYKVISPCWVHTFEDNEGKTKKQIITKGIVVPFEN